MSVESIHDRYVRNRRTQVLSLHLCEIIPENVSILDVGTGDGQLARLIMDVRPDIVIQGIDVLVREKTAIPVQEFDGIQIPYEDNCFGYAMFVDVLHHMHDPMATLVNAVRVARKGILIKDHCLDGIAAQTTLRFMDRVGNRRFGVNLPYTFWTQEQWNTAINELQLSKRIWRTKLDIYPWWADWLFGRRLHFVAKLALP